jgi:hypothetical protein
MPKYKVNMARTVWLTANVEADDEESALEAAHEVVPGFSAIESGWGSHGKFSADGDPWVPIDEFYGSEYNKKLHGPVVELDEDDA